MSPHIPRGYILASEAANRLFQSRNADLVSARAAQEEEWSRLHELIHRPRRAGQTPNDFALVDLKRMSELDRYKAKLQAQRDLAPGELRSALAEGDIEAFIIKDDGHIESVRNVRWRATDALAGLNRGRITLPSEWVPLGIEGSVGPVLFQEREGTILIQEDAFDKWLNPTLDDGFMKKTECQSPANSAAPANDDPSSDSLPELRELISRQHATQRAWNDDPANEVESEFWFEMPFRKPKLEAMKVAAQNVAAPDAVALAVRNAMLFHIDEAIDALPTDEEEVRSAPQAEMKATIERVRGRWKECDKRAAGLGLDMFSLAVTAKAPRQLGLSVNVIDQPDAEVERWHADWSKENPLASDENAWEAAKAEFPKKVIRRQVIRNMRRNPDGTARQKGRKAGRPESEFR